MIRGLLVLVLLPAAAAAHGLGLSARVTAGQLRVEVYYDDDTPARNAKVTVTDSRDAVVAEGTTDEAGVWQAPAPAAGTYRVAARAEDAHRAATTLVVEGPAAASAGPSRDEFTRFPWERILIGLAIIAALGLLLRRWLRKPPKTQA